MVSLFSVLARVGSHDVLAFCNRQVDLMEESEEEAEKPLTRTCAANSNAVAQGDVCRAKIVP